jgi:type IV secretion system protein VirD4
MSAGRVYWGTIVFVLGAIALGAIVGTQWTAHALGYQSALGAPDGDLFDQPFYAPWRFLGWWFQYDHYAREIFEQGALIFLAFTAAAVGISFFFSLWRAREAKSSDTYGSARWARAREVRKAGLTCGDGVVLGTWNRQVLRHDGDEHVLVVAPTNTGKSVGISLPTGLVWRHSFIALDLKGENWRITSGLRASFGPVFRFEPTASATHRYNPLTQIRRGEAEVRDAQVLADMLVDPEGTLGTRNHWQLRAFELLVGASLWTLYAENTKTLARMGSCWLIRSGPSLNCSRRCCVGLSRTAPRTLSSLLARASFWTWLKPSVRASSRRRWLPHAVSRPCSRAGDRSL